MTQTVHIALVNDETLFLDGFKLLLGRYSEFQILFTANDGIELMGMLKKKKQTPDIILLDLKLHNTSGLETTQQIRNAFPHVKIIVLSTYYKESLIHQMISCGVNAFLPKNTHPEELITVLKLVYEKGVYFTDKMIQVMHDQMTGKHTQSASLKTHTPLTNREKEVLTLICEQCTAPEIAEKLHISHRTVDGHRNNLLVKTGARNIAGLVIYGLLHGYVNKEEKLLEYTLNK